MVNNIALVGSSGFIGNEFLRYIKKEENINVFICKNKNDLKKIPNEYSMIFAAGKFFGTDDELWEANVEYFKTMMNEFIKTNGKQLIFLSSGAVYGDQKKKKISENEETNPHTYYGLTKLIAEDLIKYFYNVRRFKYHILRLPNVYGKNQKKGVIFNFLKNKMENKPFVIDGNGEDIRDYLHVLDLLKAINIILKKEVKNGIYNISSNLRLSVKNLSYLISKDKKYPIKYKENVNNISKLSLSYLKARQVFGFEPDINKLFLDK